MATPKKTTPKKPAKPRALIVYGGWDGHQPVECAERFAEWMTQRGFDVNKQPTLDAYLDKKIMKDLAVIIPLWTMGTISGEQSKGLADAVAAGAGLAGWHGGMCDAFRWDVGYQFMTGGQWVAHPGGCVDYTVTDLDQTDATTKGLKNFKMNSEQYYMHYDPSNTCLAWTTFDGKHGSPWIKGVRIPVVWKRMWGKGRIFYTSLGHVNKDWDVPEAFEIMKRGIQWAARIPIKPEFKSK
ncbi:MAG: ThuA domain-containing protein [Kiritimatiellaeota bacterium]|nr:ThuA domain-containing protein [Kiritimatiellota bacterium]